MYYAESQNLLPPNLFGGQAGQTPTDTVHLLVNQIKGEWRKGKVVSALFLNIKGAFSNTVNEQLIHNLKTRQVPRKIVTYIANMLHDRSTTLCFDDYVSSAIAINNGIGQGDPLSMALYQFYNADLIKIANKDAREYAEAYIDNAIILAAANTFEEAYEILKDMIMRDRGTINWAKTHNSLFEYSKLALINFAHFRCSLERLMLILPDITITPTKSTKYLSIILDQNLNWKEQLAYIQEKGIKWAAQIWRAA